MKFSLILMAIGAVLMLEPRTIYFDGVPPRVVRYERAGWAFNGGLCARGDGSLGDCRAVMKEPRPLTPSEAMLIGAPRNANVAVWP